MSILDFFGLMHKSDASKLQTEFDKLKVEHNQTLNKVTALQELLKQKQQEIRNLTDEVNELKKTPVEEKPVEKEYYRLYVDFKDMLSMINGVYYIEPSKIRENSSNDFRRVFNHIWGADDNQRVTPYEFNEEYNKLYNNRDSELINYDLRGSIIRLEKEFKEVELDDVDLYDYNHKGHLILRQTGKEVH